MEEKETDSRGVSDLFSKTRRVKEEKQGWVSLLPRAEARDWEQCRSI